MKTLLAVLVVIGFFAGCTSNEQPSAPVNRMTVGDDDCPNGRSGIISAAFKQGKSVDEVIALAKSLGDDDMPTKSSTCSPRVQLRCAAGPMRMKEIGCDSFGTCIYSFTNTCEQTFYLVESPSGESQWYGPQGCPECSPWEWN